MKLAVWLVENTAEHTPGPWTYLARGDGVPGPGAVCARVNGHALFEIGLTRSTSVFLGHPAPDGPAWHNEDVDANGRLMADSPDMLKLLARWVQFGDEKGKTLAADVRELESMRAETIAIICRHVRTGCAQVDDDARAESSHPERDSHNREES